MITIGSQNKVLTGKSLSRFLLMENTYYFERTYFLDKIRLLKNKQKIRALLLNFL